MAFAWLRKVDKTKDVVCDIQEKFSPSITHFDMIVKNTERLVKVVNMLGIPVIATEQYPKVSLFFSSILFPFLLVLRLLSHLM